MKLSPPPPSSAPQMVGLQRIIPNMITLLALIAGMTSIQSAINGNFDKAIMMLLVAGVFDVLDGAIARALKASSEFGAELDSLSDFLSFGVAPALILYGWALDEAGRIGWIAVIAVPMAAALRLARFNVMAKRSDEIPMWKKRYFSGIPTPAGAILSLLPVYIWFLIGADTARTFSFATPLIALWAIFVSAMMVSRIPTFSLKHTKVPARMTVPVMALVGLYIAALIHAPWITLTVVSVIYLGSIPLILHQYRKLEKENLQTIEDLSSLAFGIAPLATEEQGTLETDENNESFTQTRL